MQIDRRPIAWALLGTSLTLVALPALLRRAEGSAAWRAASCMPDHCFCERIRDGVMRQPVNTWASLAFVAAGLWILGSDGGSRSGAPSLRPVHRILLGVAVILIGLGSAFYHATLSFAGQFVDVFGMYLLAVFIVVYGWSRLRPLNDGVVVALYAGINAVLAALLLWLPAVRRYAFGVLILTGLALEMRVRRRRPGGMEGRYLAAAVLVLAIGFAAWTLDITRLVCAPESVLQGHALWHLAGAASAVLLFRYYASAGPTNGLAVP
ncbi:MAG TPA: ceramidase domain-containing protein [Longimicrobium sp.]|nr:ceramidase domain-containing protein [Longimicrobium sp.]